MTDSLSVGVLGPFVTVLSVLSDGVRGTLLSNELVDGFSSDFSDQHFSSSNVISLDDLSGDLLSSVLDDYWLAFLDDDDLSTLGGDNVVSKCFTGGGLFEGLLQLLDHLSLFKSELVRKLVEALDLGLLLLQSLSLC